MKILNKITALALSVCLGFSLSACSPKEESSDKSTVGLTIWNYYNGDQQIAFEEMTENFNQTTGREKGIIVEVISQGSISGLGDELNDAINGKTGAQSMPNIVAIYTDLAYELMERDLLVDLDEYFTEDELNEYIDSFIEEGRMGSDQRLLNFPVFKSTELFICNETDWQSFEEACGIKSSDIATAEELVAAAKLYYEWTDSLTPDIKYDGKGLYSRDALDNYVILSSAELGNPVFSYEEGKPVVNMDYDTFKVLWDNYYIPTINGYFGPCATYSTDDAKTGKALAVTCSSSGISYFPREVTNENDETHSIDAKVLPVPHFKDAVEDFVVQQGAGYSIIKTGEKEDAAAVEFLKWFTQEEQNLAFSIDSGYMPVKKSSISKDKLKQIYLDMPEEEQQKEALSLEGLLVTAETLNSNRAYVATAFKNSMKIRNTFKYAFIDTAQNDRAAVEEMIRQGMSKEEAVADFESEEYFNTWFNNLRDELMAIEIK